MFNFFRKESNEIAAPISGKCISIEEVNDQVFSSRMMGDGFAIIPMDDIVCSPVDGEIVLIAATKHAFGIKCKDGVELLVHIGLDTVNFNGEGFEVIAKQGNRVKKGAPIIKIDRKFMEDNSVDLTTMIIFTSGNDKKIEVSYYNKNVKVGDILIR